MSRNRIIGGFEDALERGQSGMTKAAKQTVQDFAGATKSQITGNQSAPKPVDGGTNEHAKASAPQSQASDKGANETAQKDPNGSNSGMTDAERVEFLKNLYGKKSDAPQKQPQKGSGSVKQALGIPQNDPNGGKSPEEAAKIEALRRQLHGNYYQELIRPKRKEESVSEKIEREDQEKKMSDIEEQKKKPAPLPATVKQGTGEAVVGVSG
jgi:hypothetical protein